MKIIKRSGAENTFDKEKIENAVAKANNAYCFMDIFIGFKVTYTFVSY